MASLSKMYNLESLTDNMAEYLNQFIMRRFPDSDRMAPEFRVMITEIVLDAFHDGVQYSENASGEPKQVIVQP